MSRSRSRSPILAGQIAAELHKLPQGDRRDLQQLRMLVQQTQQWSQLSQLADMQCRIGEELLSFASESAEIHNLEKLYRAAHEECKTIKQLAHMIYQTKMEAVDAKVIAMGRHSDGSPFVLSGTHCLLVILLCSDVIFASLCC